MVTSRRFVCLFTCHFAKVMDVVYSVGDCVYIDFSLTSPYGIGKIEEFRKSLDNGYLVKVALYLRTRDAPCDLMTDDEKEEHFNNTYGKNEDFHKLSPVQKSSLKKRELFCSEKNKIIPLSLIKGKCLVSCLNDAESLVNYTNKEDTFFYSVTFYPKFLSMRSTIRIGNEYQSDIPKLLAKGAKPDAEQAPETLLWTCENNLTDAQIDEFLKTTRLLETVPRALSCPSEREINDIISCAVEASRDLVLFHGMNMLHKHNYDYKSALRELLKDCHKVNAYDDISKWTADETQLFETAFIKYGKDFNKIRSIVLAWKSHQQIIEFYYMWKTTDSYIEIVGEEFEAPVNQVTVTGETIERKLVIENYQSHKPLACQQCGIALHKIGVTVSEYHLCNNCWLQWKKYG